ncbi:TULIP family P47-like protein [Glycomyces arizonensis]|uniref:TULIP family P47-like protein n=1 Tax=Glycomyces arizonensis TaxID=256035 RepID=UPI00040EE9B0|nr:TULIP family P47-like protein [Glycomyces arizonensis]
MNGTDARPAATSAARRLLSFPIVAVVAVVLLVAPASQSSAQEEGASSGLSQAIEDYLNAQDELASLEQQQEDLEAELADSRTEVEELTAELDEYAYIAYTTSDMQSMSAIMASGDPTQALNAMTMLEFLGESRADRLHQLTTRLSEIEATQQTLADTIAEQEDVTDEMEDARDEAARELAASGGDASDGPSASDAPAAEPAPRNADGTLPYQGCTEDDPTPADGCVTPRTLHALEQAQIAGFTRYVSCYRPSGSGEHPKGRACDFSAQPGGFGGDAGGDDYDYGQNLAAWFTENAHELGVQYVIWYRQIWFPSSGWRSYNGGNGDPSSDHTNHVHLSIR